MPGRAGVPKRKKRKVSSVMGWLLRRQLSEPGAGVCCAFSIAQILGHGLYRRDCPRSTL